MKCSSFPVKRWSGPPFIARRGEGLIYSLIVNIVQRVELFFLVPGFLLGLEILLLCGVPLYCFGMDMLIHSGYPYPLLRRPLVTVVVPYEAYPLTGPNAHNGVAFHEGFAVGRCL
jgi:hypothetical protein